MLLAIEATEPVSELVTQMAVELVNIHLISVQSIYYLSKGWVVGSRHLPVLLAFSTIFIMLIYHRKWVGWSEKGQNNADIIYGWCVI